MESGRNGTKPNFPEQPSIASLFPADKSDTDASSEYNQIPPNFSHYNSPFPANKSDSDDSSEYNKIPPNFSHHNSNYIDSIFTPARSETDEIIIPNPTITTSSFSHVFPSSIGPTTIQISIPSLFPPTVSDTEIDGSASSECNEAQPRVFDSIASFFPPVRSPSNVSKISETTLDHSMASIFPAEAGFYSHVIQRFLRSLSLQNYRPRGDPFKTTMEDALKALKDNNNNINIVGIYGNAGVGKTTMVKQVAEMVMIEGLFHRVVMATVSQPVNLKKIQSSIADGLELLLKKKSNVRRAKELREKIMADKRILVILDDVWELIDLSSIGIPIGSDLEACKSKILLTTRQERVCKLMGCEENRIHLNSLFPEDSWDPSIETAGTDLPPEFEAVACKIGAECHGLPSVILALPWFQVLYKELLMSVRRYLTTVRRFERLKIIISEEYPDCYVKYKSIFEGLAYKSSVKDLISRLMPRGKNVTRFSADQDLISMLMPRGKNVTRFSADQVSKWTPRGKNVTRFSADRVSRWTPRGKNVTRFSAYKSRL